ncbi:hypothetical protein SAMN04487944_101558 [Gracilibacillus ureilyticus]|uniref:Calcineurin-like phosphoesterase domain-containing protein n=1 Tax=Gracilibacillus ureilyticus TaxID=531814 RepID=A0A1H9M4V3_9BACI|nr:metallophosphoesterase [Gracilibacillus ureilyticus]SER18728.1 hypothetical protein SAMN04487944_101558 [Gracilibacillus ureilyticus]
MFKKMMWVTGILSAAAVVGKIYYDTNVVKINPVTLMTNKLRKGSQLSILQISDLHNRTFGKDHKGLLKQIKKVKADVIVLTGDLIDRKTTDFHSIFCLVKELKNINNQVFFITGNHEWDNPYLSELINLLEKHHVKILDNSHITIPFNGDEVQIIGLGKNYGNNTHVKQMIKKDNCTFTILLSHIPNAVRELSGTNIDLVLSGHTHGGQIRFPFIGSVIVPDQGVFPKFDKGLFEWDKGKLLYIDSGAGTTRLPVRFLNQAQISLIQINGE